MCLCVYLDIVGRGFLGGGRGVGGEVSGIGGDGGRGRVVLAGAQERLFVSVTGGDGGCGRRV